MAPLRLVHSVAWLPVEPAPAAWFSSRDLMALHQWMARSEEHGYHRVLIEPGGDSDLPEDGCFALLFAREGSGAAWGVARSSDGVTVWRCGTGADLGRFDSMYQALASLPDPVSRARQDDPHAFVSRSIRCVPR